MNRQFEVLNIIIEKCKEGLEPTDYYKAVLKASNALSFIQGFANEELMRLKLLEEVQND